VVTLADTQIAPTRAPDAQGSARGSSAGGEWVSHPAATVVLRVVAVVGPLLAAMTVVLFCRAVVPVPAGVFGRVTWGLAVSAAATATLFGVAVLLRRVLPLAALLRLSLAFPDQAPSRFRIARRTATLHQSQARVASALVADDDLDDANPAMAIRRCLELVASLAHHDRITRGHCERVRAYCDLIGEQMGLSPEDRQRLQWAGLLHDVGKVGVPSQVLNKRGRLTASEWEQIKEHPTIGARLTRPLEPWLGDWVRGVGEHHERWDGDGYPAGLRGTEISLAARIIAVADAFDVMTAARSYKEPLPAEAARTELVRCAGRQFDEDVVRAFVAVSIGKLRRTMGPSAALAQLPVVGSLLVVPSVGAAAPLASAALVIGSLAAPAGLHEDPPRSTSASPSSVESASPAGEDPPSGLPSDERDAPRGSPRAPEATGQPEPGGSATPTTIPVDRPVVPPVVTTPPVTGGPTTTTTTPGALSPVIDPVTEEVVDPLVDTVDGLLPGLGVGEVVDDLRCLLPILGCPP
jgi:HD domain